MEILSALIERWEAFLAFDLSSEVLIVLGGFLVFVGVMKIIGMGLKMFFWVLLVTIGLASVAYGLERTSLDLPINVKEELKDLAGPGGKLSMQAIEMLCLRMDEGAIE
ncbi:MAG: hypothetical protein KTR35_08740 [Gammaproteobacteria bacterium]|nr:hypothetical protein [Gammaproteobacteria bacterium]